MKIRLRKLLLLISTLIIITTVFSSVATAAEPHMAESERIIRVDYPLFDGLSEKDENGNYSGYCYDFLMRIAQRTGWKYEFVAYTPTNETLQDGMDKVKNGELDLETTMVYSEAMADKYEFSSVPYGETNFILMTGIDNQAINERTFSTLPVLRVALVDNANMQNELFEKYAAENHLSYQPVYAEDRISCMELVKNGEADVFISKDIMKNDGFKTVIKFATQPFYFAVTKGNTQLAEKLSQAVTEINEADPYFMMKLHQKYFKSEGDYQLSLTADELEYLKSHSAVRTIILNGLAPVEDYNSKTGEFSGIIVDIMEKISNQSGINFEYIPAASLDEAKRLLKEGRADIFAGFPYDYPTAEEYNVLLCSPIFSMPVVRVTNIHGNAENENILVSSSIKIFEGDANLTYVDNISKILDLINRGKHQIAYVNGYMAQHSMEQNSYSNIILTQTPFSNYDLCIAVHRGADLRLMSILEQVTAKLKTSEIEDIVYRNTVHSHSLSLWDYIKRNPVDFVLPFVLILIVIITLLLVLFFKSKRLNKLISEEKNRYQEISTMDRLAQTYNNDSFKQLTREYLSAENTKGAFLICDIDGFKDINDTYGHLLGDEVIRSLGSLLCSIFRNGDFVGRLGGDEFVVLMKNVGSVPVIEQRCQELLEKCSVMMGECKITLSIGISVFDSEITFEELFNKADNALYKVKKRGKNGYEICT